jgi:hypothetical protein
MLIRSVVVGISGLASSRCCTSCSPGIEPQCAQARSFTDTESSLLDHRSPLVHLRSEKLAEFLRRRAGYEQSKLFQTPPDRGIGERCDGVGMHFLHDRRRGFGGDENGVPTRDIESGQSGLRLADVTASARSWPCCISGMMGAILLKKESTRPGTRSCNAGAAPRYGTWVNSMPATRLNSSPARCGPVP